MKNRVMTSLFLVAIFLPLFLIRGIATSIMVGAVIMIVVYELTSFRQGTWQPWIRYYLLFTFIGLCFIPNRLYAWLLFMLCFSLFIISLIDEKFTIIDVLLYSVMCLITTFAGRSAMYLLSLGSVYMIYVVGITYTVDTFAFFGGKYFGKSKLIERISPKKTWEGSISGFLGGFIVSCIVMFFWKKYTLPIALLLGIVLSIMGQLGDLLFSSIKRQFKIKDYGSLLPGHGGILDRVDSLLINIVMMRFILQILVNVL